MKLSIPPFLHSVDEKIVSQGISAQGWDNRPKLIGKT